MNFNVFSIEYLDLVCAAEVIHDANDIDGFTVVICLGQQIAVAVTQHDGTYVHHHVTGLAGQGHGAIIVAAIVGGVDVDDLQVLHGHRGAHEQVSIGKGLRLGLLAVQRGHDLDVDGAAGKQGGINLGVSGLVTLAEFDGVAGIIGLELAVVDIGYLPGAAGLVVLHRAYHADTVAHLEDVQQLAGGVAVVHGHAVVLVGLSIVLLNVHGVIAVVGDDALKGDLHIVIQRDVGAQTLQIDLIGVAVVEIGVLLAGEDVELLQLSLLEGGRGSFAVAVVDRAAGDGQTVLDQLQIQAAVVGGVGVLVPYPHGIAIAGGIRIPLIVVRLDHDLLGAGQLLFGKTGGFFAPLFDLTGRLGGVNTQITCLQHAVTADAGGNKEVGGVTVNVILDGDLLLQGGGVQIQLGLGHVVLDLRLLLTAVAAAAHQAGQQHTAQHQ